MLPGKTYRPEDMLALARKRAWLILVPVAIAAAGAALFAKSLPNIYRAETLILMIPQKVPDSYVRQTVTTRLDEQLQAIRPSLLSRTRLEQLIKDYDLYADERRRMVLEDVVELMRREVDVDPRPQTQSFVLRYTGKDPYKVRDVTNRLANMFIDESMKFRATLADSTDAFLDSRLDDAKRRLVETEARLAAYRRDHAGELPSQFESNLQQVKNAQAQAQAAVDNINRLTDRRAQLVRDIADLESSPATAAAVATAPETGNALGAATQRLQVAMAELTALEAAGNRPTHPDVVAVKRRIAELQVEAEAEAKATGRPVGPILSPSQVLRQRQLADRRADLDALDKQIAAARQDEQKFRANEQLWQSRLDAVPVRESELVALMRDYGTVDGLYKDLLSKKENSKMSAELERRQIGEQFQVLDPAQTPERPISPNRPRLILLTTAAALALGLALVGLMEYRDRTFKVDEDVQSVVRLPVLATIPLMRSEREQKRRLIGRILMNAGLGALVTACAVVVVYAIRG